jgi:hypothetical protein
LPLTKFTEKDHVFVWSTNANCAFEELKQAFTSPQILIHVDPAKLFG